MAPRIPSDLTTLLLTLSLVITFVQGQQTTLTYSVREESDPDTYVGNIARDSEIYQLYNQTTFQALSVSLCPCHPLRATM